MLKPRQTRARPHWESLTDDQLLNLELTTDDPEGLPDLVTEFPGGDEEPYVEFKYDMRKSGRPEFTCVHGHHQHLAGFVMRKGNSRYLVGWKCGETLYGESFEGYKLDYSTAVNRQATLRRRRQVEECMSPLVPWMEDIIHSDLFEAYDRVRYNLSDRMPWIWENIPRAAYINALPKGVKMPHTMFRPSTDLDRMFGRSLSDLRALISSLGWQQDFTSGNISKIKIRAQNINRDIETVLNALSEMLDFFQPTALQAVCAFANEHDNPKRRYEPGMLELVCRRTGKEKVAIQIPRRFNLPDPTILETVKERLRVL